MADPFFEGVLLQFDQVFAPDLPEFNDATDHPEVASGAASAVAVVLELMAKLGLSQKDVLSAAGVRKRTFQDWQRNPSREPRLSSQADLWALAQSIDVIAESLGGDLAGWLKADPERIKMLRRGEHRELARLTTRADTEDPAAAALERRMGVGFFDEGERPDGTPRPGAAAPVSVSTGVRARAVGEPS